jgi:hypothetical protein
MFQLVFYSLWKKISLFKGSYLIIYFKKIQSKIFGKKNIFLNLNFSKFTFFCIK